MLSNIIKNLREYPEQHVAELDVESIHSYINGVRWAMQCCNHAVERDIWRGWEEFINKVESRKIRRKYFQVIFSEHPSDSQAYFALLEEAASHLGDEEAPQALLGSSCTCDLPADFVYIQERPMMYFSNINIRLLYASINGFEAGRSLFGAITRPPVIDAAFKKWISRRYEVQQTLPWYRAIEYGAYLHNQVAYDLFFKDYGAYHAGESPERL